MFTGLVKEMGKLISIKSISEGKRLRIQAPKLIQEIGVDDSVSVNGVCQTAVAIDGDCFEVIAVHTTLEKTTLGKLKDGEKLNLELAVRASDRLGGHIVQGHVNGVARLKTLENKGENFNLTFSINSALRKYIVAEGSIAIDGISLTVSCVGEDWFGVTIIPHTWKNTVLGQRKVNDAVNIEVDILAKYLENLIKFQSPTNSKLTEGWIREQGF
ncbi:MAG: riboflavin synthase [Halobacteriovorax sp.]|nr:riboflavin synthase [Halobacteriovorax sp.]